MKKQFLLLAGTIFTTATLFAQTGQIANNSFDTWSSDGYNPVDWTTVASALPAALAGTPYASFASTLQPQFAPAATEDTNNKVDGTASVKLTTIATPSLAASVLGPTTPGLVGLGNLNMAAAQAGSAVLLDGSAFPYKPDTILFQYNYAPAGTDTATLILKFTRQGTDVAGGTITKHLFSTGGAWVTDTTVINSWTDAPDTAIFQLSSGWQQGSVMNVDALHFGYVTPPAVIPAVSVTSSADTINAGETAYFIATLDQATTVDLTVNINPSGTAVYSTDYTATASSFSFLAGETVDTITVTTTASSAGKDIIVPLVSATDNSYTLGSNSSKTLYIKSTTTGIASVNKDLNAIKLYPNPVSSAVIVEVPSEVNTQNIVIVDMTGRAVQTVNNIAGKATINVEGLNSGNYLVTFTNAINKSFTGSKALQVKK